MASWEWCANGPPREGHIYMASWEGHMHPKMVHQGLKLLGNPLCFWQSGVQMGIWVKWASGRAILPI